MIPGNSIIAFKEFKTTSTARKIKSLSLLNPLNSLAFQRKVFDYKNRKIHDKIYGI